MTPAPARESVFAALADGTRLRLLEVLGEGPPATASILARGLPVSRQAVARHLEVLEGAHLVRRERLGREVRFLVEPDSLADAGAWLSARADQWRARLELLKARLEEGPTVRTGTL